MLKEYNEMKEETKNLKTWPILPYANVYRRFWSICLKCRKNTESINPKVARAKDGRIMFLSKIAVCDSKKSKLVKQQEAIHY